MVALRGSIERVKPGFLNASIETPLSRAQISSIDQILIFLPQTINCMAAQHEGMLQESCIDEHLIKDIEPAFDDVIYTVVDKATNRAKAMFIDSQGYTSFLTKHL